MSDAAVDRLQTPPTPRANQPTQATVLYCQQDLTGHFMELHPGMDSPLHDNKECCCITYTSAAEAFVGGSYHRRASHGGKCRNRRLLTKSGRKLKCMKRYTFCVHRQGRRHTVFRNIKQTPNFCSGRLSFDLGLRAML